MLALQNRKPEQAVTEMPDAARRRDERIERILSELIPCLVKHLQPRRIILFGSRAKGSARPGSDIDLAVAGGKVPTFREERKLREELDRLAGIYSVDLVFLQQTDDTFRAMTEETGKVLYEKD